MSSLKEMKEKQGLKGPSGSSDGHVKFSNFHLSIGLWSLWPAC